MYGEATMLYIADILSCIVSTTSGKRLLIGKPLSTNIRSNNEYVYFYTIFYFDLHQNSIFKVILFKFIRLVNIISKCCFS